MRLGGQLRVGRCDGRILNREQCRSALGVLPFAAPSVGEEDEDDWCFSDKSLAECGLCQSHFGLGLFNDKDEIGLQIASGGGQARCSLRSRQSLPARWAWLGKLGSSAGNRLPQRVALTLPTHNGSGHP